MLQYSNEKAYTFKGGRVNMVSISDVAKQAHVSKMTVSRVLNHPEQVSKEIFDTVQTAINELGYVQNRAGRALATNKSYTIAFVMLDEVAAVDPYFGQLVTYIADILNQAGYTMELHRSLDNDFHAIDGILVSGARESDDAQLNALTYPLVTYGEQAGAASVDVDNAAGIKLAKQHLVDAGYEQLIYLGLDLDEQFAQARLDGFLDSEIPVDQNNIYRIANDDHIARSLVQTLQLAPKTGIVAATDRLALGALYACLIDQQAVPQDVGIVGFDGIFIHQMGPLTLTTIAQPLERIAEAMVSQLLEQIEQPVRTNPHIVLTPELQLGETTLHN